MLPPRQIAHFDLDSFFVSVERLLNPKLVGKPVIVGGHSHRGVVAACSYETRQFGVQSAMPIHQAKQLCPQAIIVQGSMSSYSQFSKQVTSIIQNQMPLVEKASIDEFYIDLTGLDKYFGAYKLTQQLKQQIITQTGLPVSFAIASNKLISKIATNEAKPNGEIQIPLGSEKAYLAPLKIQKIPMIGKTTTQLLNFHHIYIIEQLASTPIQTIIKLLGNHGQELHNKANGIDNNPVEPIHQQKSISSETTFQTDISDHLQLSNHLVVLVEKICYQLRKENKLTSSLSIKLKFSNFQVVNKQIVIDYTNQDHEILLHAKQLLKAAYTNSQPLRLIGLKLSNLITANNQLNLFSNSKAVPHLYIAIDQVKKKYGNQIIKKAITIKPNTK
jgi:DNA polymerase IV